MAGRLTSPVLRQAAADDTRTNNRAELGRRYLLGRRPCGWAGAKLMGSRPGRCACCSLVHVLALQALDRPSSWSWLPRAPRESVTGHSTWRSSHWSATGWGFDLEPCSRSARSPQRRGRSAVCSNGVPPRAALRSISPSRRLSSDKTEVAAPRISTRRRYISSA